jgi:AcrR family transcriptional regulator
MSNIIVYYNKKNMIDNKLNTEQMILEAAEAEFLKVGYSGAKTVSIAKRAGISHSMLHYYFRSKENLFQMIFRQKIQTLSQMFESISDHLTFEEAIRLFIEKQFDFVAQNPRLPRFILNEITAKRDNLNLVIEVVRPKIELIFSRMGKLLNKEIAKGGIRPISFRDFIMNIISLNISTFIILPVLENILPAGMDEKTKESYLNERRESNVQFILNALKP